MKSKPTAAGQFQHNGVTIIVSTAGNFCAHVGGIEVRKPSLDAMKKHIDRARPFAPFDAIQIRHYRGHEIEKFRIVGTKPNGRRDHRAAVLWLGERGATYIKVLRDTPANRKKLAAYAKERDVIRVQEEALNERMQALEESIEGEAVPAPEAQS